MPTFKIKCDDCRKTGTLETSDAEGIVAADILGCPFCGVNLPNTVQEWDPPNLAHDRDFLRDVLTADDEIAGALGRLNETLDSVGVAMVDGLEQLTLATLVQSRISTIGKGGLDATLLADAADATKAIRELVKLRKPPADVPELSAVDALRRDLERAEKCSVNDSLAWNLVLRIRDALAALGVEAK